MARAKLDMKRIEKTTKREVTFRKRREGLLKKARELSILCDAEVAIILFSSSGRLFEYTSSRSMQEIIQSYFDTHEGKPSEPLAYYEDEVKRLKEELQRLQREERRKSGDMEELNILSMMDLEELECEMVSKLNSVRETKHILIAEKTKEFGRKEQELMRENESLKNELKRARCGFNEEPISTCNSYHDEDTVASVESNNFL